MRRAPLQPLPPSPLPQPRSRYEDCAKPDLPAGEHLEALQQAAAAWAGVAAAELRAGELRESAAAREGLEGMRIEEGEAAAGVHSVRVAAAVLVLRSPRACTWRCGGRGACAVCGCGTASPALTRPCPGHPGGTAGKKRPREDTYLQDDLDSWEPFVGAGKGAARLCRCARS